MGTFLPLNMFAIQYQNTIAQVKRRGGALHEHLEGILRSRKLSFEIAKITLQDKNEFLTKENAIFPHNANKMHIQIHERNVGINQKDDTHS